MTLANLNPIHFLATDATDYSAGVVLYTPPSKKILIVKRMTIAWKGGADANFQLYDATTGTTDQRWDCCYDYDATGKTECIIPIPDLSLPFGAACLIKGTATEFSVMFEGILI